MEALHQLPSAELESIAAALRTGRLEAPYSEFALQRYTRTHPTAQVSGCLNRLAGEGLSSHQTALVLSAIIETRNRSSPESEVTELVWTGPDIAGAINRDTRVVVRDLFGRATREVLVAGFAVYQGKEVFRRLADRMVEIPELRVRFFLDIRRNHGDTTLASELVWKFLAKFRSKDWPVDKLPNSITIRDRWMTAGRSVRVSMRSASSSTGPWPLSLLRISRRRRKSGTSKWAL